MAASCILMSFKNIARKDRLAKFDRVDRLETALLGVLGILHSRHSNAPGERHSFHLHQTFTATRKWLTQARFGQAAS